MAVNSAIGVSDLVREATERLQLAWTQDRENREDAYNDLRFLASDQWPSNIRMIREAQNRPCLTINRLKQFVNQIANNVRANPPSMKAIPTGGGATPALADIYTGILRQIQRRSNSKIVFSQALYYAVACGIGHFRIVTDYVDDNVFDQEIKIKHIPYPLSVFWDPNATEITRSDAEYCLVSSMIGRDEFEAKFNGASATDFNYPSDLTIENGLFWSNRDAVRVAEYWVKRYKKRTIARLATGETIDITDVEHNKVSQLQILATRPLDSYEIVQYLMSGKDVLNGPNKWVGRHIPIFPVIGQEVALETKIIRSGLIRDAKDAQVAYNYHRSAAVETIALAPRAPWLVTPAMISRFKAQWDTANTISRPYMLFEPDGELMPRREPPPEVPAALLEESKVASDEMKATTGVYDAALGARSNEISGIAIKARESQGDNASVHYQDNLVATLEHCGAAIIDLIPRIYDADRVVAILNDKDEAQTVRINVAVPGPAGQMVKINDMTVGEYQLAVKMGPSYATQRQETVSSLLELAQAVPTTGQMIDDIIVENMDFPGAEEAARRLKSAKPPAISGIPPSPQQMQQQQKVEQFHDGMAQAQLANAQGDALKKHAEAARTAAETQQIQRGEGPGGNGELSAQDAALVDQRTPEDVQAAVLKNALLAYTVRERAARATDANLLAQGRQLDNARKMQDLNRPRTEAIP